MQTPKQATGATVVTWEHKTFIKGQNICINKIIFSTSETLSKYNKLLSADCFREQGTILFFKQNENLKHIYKSPD